MRRWMASLMIAVLLVMSFAPMALADDTVYYTTKKVKLREAMSTDSYALVTIPEGKKVIYLDSMLGSKWANVSWNGYYGYIQWKNLSETKKKPTPTAKPTPKPTAKPTAKPTTKPTVKPTVKPTKKPVPTAKPQPTESLKDFKKVDYFAAVTLKSVDSEMNMRWQPNTDSDVVGVYKHGDVLHVLMEGKSWAQVMDPATNRVGYMKQQYLTVTEEPKPDEEEQLVGEDVVSPMNEMDDLGTLLAAVPGLTLYDAPEGASDVTYNWINTDPIIAQIEFKLNGIEYCYRAAKCDTAEDQTAIDGIYAEMHEVAEREDVHLCYDEEEQFAAVHYFSEAEKAQYSLVAPVQPDGGEGIMAIAWEMLPD